jgi:hypothetical protein
MFAGTGTHANQPPEPGIPILWDIEAPTGVQCGSGPIMLRSIKEWSSHLDLGKALQNLYAERRRLERIITRLQALQQIGASAPPKPMDAAERKPVSARTKRCRMPHRPAN